jgi:hypothetical protein
MIIYRMLIIVLLTFVNNVSSQELRLKFPLYGTEGIDFFIDGYVDHDTSKNFQDVFCKQHTYNGHNGTDININGFREMDSGVNVMAAADGIVLRAVDGFYDRSKKMEKGGYGNHLLIMHADSTVAFYGHLKKKSLRFKRGDHVSAGDILGEVGSSGYSRRPHLHFELRDKKNNVIDPFVGDCSERPISLWQHEPTLNESTYLIDAGFCPYIPRLDTTLLERYLVTDTFIRKKDTVVCFWTFVHGLKTGDVLTARWSYKNITIKEISYNWNHKGWNEYTWTWMKIPMTKGKWNLTFLVNHHVLTTRSFYLK